MVQRLALHRYRHDLLYLEPTMTMHDLLNLPLSNATADSVAAFNQACRELHTYTDDPVASSTVRSRPARR